jgi:quercetin dioxygenase-like cupin family protein
MEASDLTRLLAGHDFSKEPYLEFLRAPSLSVGLYVLPAGATDPQQPHTEDEVYHVVSGKGRIRVGAEDRAVEAGTVVFVEAGVDHRFHDIEEDLRVLVFFAPAEGSRGER